MWRGRGRRTRRFSRVHTQTMIQVRLATSSQEIRPEIEMLLRQLSFAIKTQLKAPRGISSLFVPVLMANWSCVFMA